MLAGEADELAGASGDSALFGCGGDCDAPAAAELEKPFVSEGAEGSEHGVGVDPDYGREVAGGWKSFARFASPSAMARRSPKA